VEIYCIVLYLYGGIATDLDVIPINSIDKFLNNNFLSNINLLLATSRYEGSPYLFQDACMASIPIISSNVGGVEFFVKNDYNGYVYENDEEAAYLINKCLMNSNFISKIPDRSINILKNFSLENMTGQTLKAYLAI